MIICYVDGEKAIKLRWREDGIRVERSIDDFRPYFFILSNDNKPAARQIKNYGKTETISLDYEEGNWVDIDGNALTKVSLEKPGNIRSLRNSWNKTYEADVPFHYRYCVDELTEIPEYNMRKWYWDMEWLSNDPLHGDAITTIVVYDNYNKMFKTYTWFPEPQCGINKVKFSGISIYDSEKEMLEAFANDLQEQDPDMLIAWFGLKFDLPKLIHRMFENGIDPRCLSPYRDVKGVSNNKLTGVDNYSPIEQPIRGRICLNLDLAFERQWNDAQRGTLPSLALDYIAETVLGEKKLVSEKFPDKNEFFTRGWLEDTKTYLHYAKIDVDLIRRIDEENFTSESIIALQRLLKAPFDACFYASNMGSIYFMRHASWKAPTSVKVTECENCKTTVPLKKKCIKCGLTLGSDYDGAMIYHPLSEGTNGLHLGVAAFDFAGLYPSMMLARNISWETKSTTPTEFGVNLKTPRDFSETNETDMRYYKTDKLGLLPTSVLELKTLRDNYKKKMKEAYVSNDMLEYKKWNVNQMAVKRLMASFYGIIAYRGFGWYDIDVAASITASAREAIRSAAFKVKGMEV